ncbi:MAG: hypothetical protein GY847_20155 [Proteobacteria bacterium]|nr:hypothetical protein [Pseudomonadota bacterium]
MWTDAKVKVMALTIMKRPCQIELEGAINENFCFSIVNNTLGNWVLVHRKTMRMAPSIFIDRNDAIRAAELFEALGDWDSGIKDWVEYGIKVPFAREARQVACECGGAYVEDLKPLSAPQQSKPKYLC